MTFSSRPLRSLVVSYSKTDLFAVLLIAAVVAGWAAVAGGAFSVRVLFACEALFFSYYLTGSLFASFRSLARGVEFELPLRLLVGYGVVNTALFALAWLSPWGIVANFGVLLALTLTAFFAAGERKLVQGSRTSLWVVALCLLGTTLWCQDSISPIAEQGDRVAFKPWVDGFYHAVHIRIFAASHGAASIEDWRLAGVAARPYHYGIYMLPALVKQASGIHSYTAFAGVLAPVGVFFTGLAAAAFFGSLWGPWPGLAAALALLLSPDGAQQGMQNPFLSYHWLTQISPSATYGLALLAVAWLFVVKGCTHGSRGQLLVGWVFAGVVAVYKLHYVIASSLLLLLIPALFFQGISSGRRRALWVVAALGAYAAVLFFVQRVPGVPVIRFDGSSVGAVLQLVHSFSIKGTFREWLAQRLGESAPLASNLLFGVPYILFATLGLFVPLLVVLVVRLRRSPPLLHVLFPVLLIANFLVMFFGLALDRASSTPDELSHRPVMIVYFFVVSWVGGAAGLALVESRRLGRVAGPVLLGLALVLLVVPAHFGAGVQQMWVMPQMSPVRLPRTFLRVAEYIRAQGGVDDIVQDSQFDRIYALGALSERRTFVTHSMTRMPYRGEMVEGRSDAIDHFLGIRRSKLLVATAGIFGFRWFLLAPGQAVDWPPEIALHPALESGPFRLYDFKAGPKAP